MENSFQYNDGGRSLYFNGNRTRDCVTRAIAIATELDYKQVYDDLAEGMKKLGNPKSARNGVYKKVYHTYILNNGFTWIATMGIGTGCTVHLHKDELPKGILLVRVSRHLTCMINGVIHDTYNPQRGSLVGAKDGEDFTQKETRCVYGYYKKNRVKMIRKKFYKKGVLVRRLIGNKMVIVKTKLT